MMNLIEIKGVEKEYRDGDSKTLALRGVDLSLNDPEMIAIVGPSGCGKTTLVNILGLLLNTTKGTVSINGQDISEYTDAQKSQMRNEMFGYVTQDFSLIEDQTVFDNVRIPLMLSKKKPTKKQQKKQVHASLKKLNIEHFLDKRVSKLSGGERQRLAIIRSIINNPKIIIADEPTGSLDDKNAGIIFDMLRELVKQSKIVVLVTHNMALANMCDRILVLDKGKLVSLDETR